MFDNKQLVQKKERQSVRLVLSMVQTIKQPGFSDPPQRSGILATA